MKKKIAFLGYNIDRERVSMDQGQVKAVLQWPTPVTVKDLQRFLGYQTFIADLLEITVLLQHPSLP